MASAWLASTAAVIIRAVAKFFLFGEFN